MREAMLYIGNRMIWKIIMVSSMAETCVIGSIGPEKNWESLRFVEKRHRREIDSWMVENRQEIDKEWRRALY